MSTISNLSVDDLQSYNEQVTDAVSKYDSLRKDVVKTKNLKVDPQYYDKLNAKLVGDYSNLKQQQLQKLYDKKKNDMQMYEKAVTLDEVTKYTRGIEE